MPGNSKAPLVPQQGLGQEGEPRKWEMEHKRYPTSETEHNQGGDRIKVKVGHSINIC